MADLGYQDFDMSIEKVGDEYRVKVHNSPVGQASGSFELPFKPLELENFFLRIGQPSRTVRRMGSDEGRAAEDFGQKLYDAAFGGDVGTAFLRSVDAADADGEGLRIRLNVGDLPELADLPWEYLYSRTLGRFIVLSNHTPIVRHLDLQGAMRALEVDLPIRVLVVVSSPTDFDKLNVDREKEKLSDSLSDLVARGVIEVEFTEDATVRSLQRKLRDRTEYHILHFIGHGGFDDATDEGVLLFEDENERGRKVTGRTLGTFLHDHRSLRLVILNACEGARTAQDDPFGGVAQALLHNRIPAVVAMQFAITDEAAITFADAFYAAIADGLPVDGSVAAARKAIMASDNDVEWGTPVLYLRAEDGRIFDVSDVPPVPRTAAEVVGATDAAAAADEAEVDDAAFDDGRIAPVVDLPVTGPGPTEPDPGGTAAPARGQQSDVAVLYRQAVDLRNEGKLQRAAASFRRVVAMDPTFNDAADQLSEVTIDLRAETLYADAATLIERGAVDDAQAKLREVADIRPGFGDPDGLIEHLRLSRVSEDAGGGSSSAPASSGTAAKRRLGTAAKLGIGAVGATVVLGIIGTLLPEEEGATPTTQATQASTVATQVTATTQVAQTGGQLADPVAAFGLNPIDHDEVFADFGTPRLDGDLSEWVDFTSYSSEHIVATNEWDQSQDHRVAWRVAADAAALYFAVVVTDDVIVQEETGVRAFLGDSVNVDLAFNEDGGSPGLTDFQVILSPGDFVSTPPSAAVLQGNGTIYEPISLQPSTDFIQVIANRVDGGYTMEIGISWLVFDGNEPFDDMGFRLSANDNDEPGRSLQQVMYSNVPGSSLFDTNTYGWLLFP